MRSALSLLGLLRTSACAALLLEFCACTQPSRPPSGTDCHPTTDAELGAISAGEVPCDWLWVVETELEDLEGLRGHDDPFEGVLVVQNDRLRSLGGLEDLTDLSTISVTQNAALTEIDAAWHGVAEINIGMNNAERVSLSVSPHAEGVLQLNITDEPVNALAVTGSARLTALHLYRLPELSSVAGLADIETADVVEIQDLPQLSEAELDAFLAGLDPAPALVKVCGAAGRPPC